MSRWKPSKSQARKFAQTMAEIDEFCEEHGIAQSASSDSYYFTLRGQKFRVSNHTVDASNKGAFDDRYGQIREKYHPGGEREDTVYITAGKTRIREIYQNLADGKKLDRRGNVVQTVGDLK